ncbi:chemotaxis protein CheY [Bacillus carboniphilus]|uniref:Chemotaxis protein CheY n=1 Tax=Bacillus carboniphilus TaxID=86663 RepID=A0ABN0VTZ0_9BACI
MATIMISDDAMFMRMQLKDILTKLGHDVVGEAENGLEAIEKYRELKPDLVTMDITMPETNGVEAVKGIKEVNPNATIIMCSAMGQKDMVVDAIKAGAKDFVVKPFDPKRIQEAVENALK